MIDLISLDYIQSQLQQLSETRIGTNDAYRVAQQLQVTYEADRVANLQVIDTLKAQVDERWALADRLQTQVETLTAQLAVALADVHITIGATPITSRTTTAVSFVENPPVWTTTAWPTSKASLGQSAGAYKTHIQPFGLSSPWRSDANGPLESKPSQWYAGRGLGVQLQHIREADATAPIVLTLYGAEWWMLESVAQDGTRTAKTYANRFDDNGRVKFDQLGNWLIEADGAVEVAAKAGCRDFEVWNECKGYYTDPWDMSMTGVAGKAVGYSYFYKVTAAQIIATMTRLGFARTDYRIAAPYIVFATRGDKTADALPDGHPLTVNHAKYGYLQKQPVNALRDFLKNARDNNLPLDMLALDASTYLKSGDYPSTNPFDYLQKFEDLLTYAESCLAEFGFDPHMDKVFSELYPTPDPTHQTADSEQLRAVLWAETLRICIRHGVRYPIMWGSTSPAGGSFHELGGLIDSTGALQATGDVFRMFRANFGPGARVYPLVCSDGRVDGNANDTMTVVYNKTATQLSLDVAGKVVDLPANAVIEVMR